MYNGYRLASIELYNNLEELNELAVFAGAGGGLLASKLLGWRTVCAVEIDEYARRVLLARQNDRILEPFPIWDDVCTFDGRPWRGRVGVVSGGFPCTNISIARAMWGRDGLNGECSGLWWHQLRIIDECETPVVWAENSPELARQGLDQIVHALSKRGFFCRWITLGAKDCGLPHVRKRLWLLATNSHFKGLERYAGYGDAAERRKDPPGSTSHAAVRLCPFCGYPMETDDRYGCPNCLGEGFECDDCGEELLPRITGMADGVAHRVERLTVIGNGQVPTVAARAWRLLNDVRIV